MDRERKSVKASTVERRPVAIARAPAVPGRASAIGTGLQQRLGNRGTQAIAGQICAKSSAGTAAPSHATTGASLSISQPGDILEREADHVADQVMRMAEAPSAPHVSHAATDATIQRRCAKCEEEEDHTQLQRKEASANAAPFNASLSASINALTGKGSALPSFARNFFEPRFGADFSQVRIHAGTEAGNIAQSINARAFTVGQNIAFAPGQYAPHSEEGQRLLAHELTHVLQQKGASTGTVQRDDEPGVQPEEPATEAAPTFVPEGVVLELLYLLEQEDPPGQEEEHEEESGEELSERESRFQEDLDYATTWVGHGASAERKILMLRSEDFRLQKAAYHDSVVNSFGSEEYPEEEYLAWLIETYDAPSNTEEDTLARFKANMLKPDLTDSSFIDDEHIQQWDGGNAFPNFAWNIIHPLVSPSTELVESTKSRQRGTQAAYYESWNDLGWDLYGNGIPASYSRSLGITEYSTVKKRSISKLLKMPDIPWLYGHFVMHEEVPLHTAAMKAYTTGLTAYVLASLGQAALDKWLTASAFRWSYFDAAAISAFRKSHPSGLRAIEDFYNYAPRGLALGATLSAAKVKAGIQTSGVNPYLFLSKVSADAQAIGPNLINQLNASELTTFANILANADSKIIALEPSIRLMTAVEWSITKGFAAQGIVALLGNLDKILWEILEEYVKDKAVKKAVMTGVGYLGPWGRAISIIYNLLELFDDVRDKIELALLIKSFVEVLDEAKQSKGVVQTQQASAKLAQVYETTFQLLIQKLGQKVLSKVSASTARRLKEKRPKGEKMGDAERTNLLEEARREKDAKKLKPEYLEAEFATAIRSPVRVVGDAIEIELPNGHRWKRQRGAKGWCRASEDCVGDFLNPDITDELDFYTRRHLPDDFDYDGYPSLAVDDIRLHQTTKGNFGEVASDHMLDKQYANLGGITRTENPDRGPGIDNVWMPKDRTHFDYTISETKFVQGFDGDLHTVKMGKSRSGPQLSDSWITGRNFNTMKHRLEEVVGEDMAGRIRSSVRKNRVERLLIVVNETGRTWVYEVDSGGKAYRLKPD